MLKYFLWGFIVFSVHLAQAQSINWLSVEEALENQANKPRMFLIVVEAPNCSACDQLFSTTFRQNQIASIINKHYYPVRFNAAKQASIVPSKRKYQNHPHQKDKYQELYKVLTSKQFDSPTLVFLDKNLTIIQAIPGYQSAEDFEVIAQYFATEQYRKTPWQNYQSNFKQTKLNSLH